MPELLSADTLFNFTHQYDWFKSKLIECVFTPRFVLEDLSFIKQDFKLAFPMVCFCDIPLSLIRQHTERYGGFGIGLNSNWGIKNGLSCICYIPSKDSGSSNSALYKSIRNLMDKLSSNVEIDSDVYNVLRYMKRYEGIQQKRGGRKETVRFYDEREWRYVPSYNKDQKDAYFYLNEDDFDDFDLLAGANQSLHNQLLIFKPTDIEIIIVPTEYDKKKVITEILNVGLPFKSADISVLISKIETLEQINRNVWFGFLVFSYIFAPRFQGKIRFNMINVLDKIDTIVEDGRLLFTNPQIRRKKVDLMKLKNIADQKRIVREGKVVKKEVYTRQLGN